MVSFHLVPSLCDGVGGMVGLRDCGLWSRDGVLETAADVVLGE